MYCLVFESADTFTFWPVNDHSAGYARGGLPDDAVLTGAYEVADERAASELYMRLLERRGWYVSEISVKAKVPIERITLDLKF